MGSRPTKQRAPVYPVVRAAVVMSAVVVGGWLAPTVTTAHAASDTFSISGDAAGLLTPGVTQLLDLRLDNLVNRTLNVQSLQVQITDMQTLQGGTCTPADFTVQQALLGAVTLPAGVSNLLSSLGPGILALPQITMLDTAVNQDGCKNAVVSLAYSGTALDPNGNQSGGHGSNGHSHHGNDGDGNNGVADEHSGLPGTGADPATWWVGAVGLAFAVSGATVVRITRRRKEARP